ncbi:RNA polymerase sigma-70 factor, ECF subfamily [Rhodanobacter glycinis]|uniref:RNA polymerase sigma-70 factor, ECF subfamily n=2 Tax=Rhodanobacter glycinis TaxID=582702 RepID=A0A1I4DLM3_9GAMM|nr:RNA polymerase sigma-70 factor, ECF subfamily [Rhodanobacter glycinis]
MATHRTQESLSPFETARAMSSLEPHAKDASYWASQMAAVSCRRDRDCFMRIYDHYAPRLRLYLRGIGSPEAVAEELAQEALLRLWQRAASYDATRSSLSTWLFRIARNLHIDRLRREPLWVPVDDEPGWPDRDEEGDVTSAESHAEQVDLRRRIERLPAVQARLIRMSYFEAKSHHEIASELAMPLGTVKSSLRRAFIRLQLGVRGQP